MKLFAKMIILFFLTTAFGCSGIRVSQDYDLSRDFSGLQTYDWQSEKQRETGDVQIDNPLFDSRIRTAIDRVFLNKSYKKVFQGTPDFLVAYQYAIRTKIRSNTVRTGVGIGVGTYGHRGGVSLGTGTEIRQYDQGILVIDIIDPHDGSLMWRGTSSSVVWLHSNPEETTERVNKTVEKIMKQFPPGH